MENSRQSTAADGLHFADQTAEFAGQNRHAVRRELQNCDTLTARFSG
jgi:hypothetical protein